MPYQPAQHQVEGLQLLMENDHFALFDDPGTGKSKVAVDAAQFFATEGQIEALVVFCPAQVVKVWFDPIEGEVAKHATCNLEVFRLTSPMKTWSRRADHDPDNAPTLKVIITSYEMMRRADRKSHLENVLPDRCMMVCDESHSLKSHKAEQTVAMRLLRYSGKFNKCYLLTGSPCDQSPLDLFSQLNIMNRDITSMNYFQFRAHYCNMGGYMNKKLMGYKNLPSLASLLQHWCRRVREDDVWELPTKHHTMVESTMDQSSWEAYKSMQLDLVTMLDDPAMPEGVKAANAAVRTQKLAQIANGHIKPDAETGEDTVLIHDHKVRRVVEWLDGQQHPDHFVIWTQFRADVDQLMVELDGDERYEVFALQGGQSQKRKDEAIDAFQTGQTVSSGGKSRILIANAQAGKQGLNLASSCNVLYVSQSWSLTTHRQTVKRTHRKGQDRETSYTYVLATGPNGEHTIDHAIYMALKNKQTISTWTTDHWRAAYKGSILPQDAPEHERLFNFGDVV